MKDFMTVLKLQQVWTLKDFIVVLLPFPYVQFSQFKVCNNKCELKVGKWARMNNLDENGNFPLVSLWKFGHLDRTYKLIQIFDTIKRAFYDFWEFYPKRFFLKFMSAFEIPAVGAVPFHAAFHHARAAPVSFKLLRFGWN